MNGLLTRAKKVAADKPAGPPPMIRRSVWVVDIVKGKKDVI
jgi:hypothetical protein